MTTMHRRRQWRDRRPVTMEELHMSNQYVAVLCVLAGIGTALVLLLLIFGQSFANLFFGG
ncbi:hypothetical protein B0G74_7864 [Paraburkholderia sp. BL9I2N2]|nr:hypothetical protein B0G74_7864 [Paraburkholderia sp. BL9I2N2]